MVNLGSIYWSVEVAEAADAAASAQQVQEQMGKTADKAQQANQATNQASQGMGEMADTSGDASRGMGRFDRSLDSFRDTAGLATTAVFFLRSGIAKLLSLVGGGGLKGLLSLGGTIGLGKLISGVGLGSLISKVTFASLLKGAASLGALVIAADTITDIIDGKAPLQAFVDSAEDFGELVLNPIGIDDNDLVEKVVGIGTFILGTMSIASFITGVPISTMIIGGAGAAAGAGTSIAAFLGFASLGALVLTAGSIALLIGGMASLGDLVDGDISDWNLPAKFGKALGEGFARAWPDMADRIHGAFTSDKNPFFRLGQTVSDDESSRDFFFDVNEDAGSTEEESHRYLGNAPGGQTGGRIGQTGLAVIHEDEQLINPSTAEMLRSASGMTATGDFLFGGAQGGRIQSSGIMQVHEGEELVPADVTRDLQMVDNITDLGGGRGGGSGTSVRIDTITMNLDGDFDPSNVARRDLDSLADRLVDLIGDKTNRRAGVR